MNNSSIVALVGRPNVGKSTLFNRLIGRRKAIESEIPGTTRDRLYGEVFWAGKNFDLIDLAGVEKESKSEMAKAIKEGVEEAIELADVILFLVDWNDPENEMDKMVARDLRKRGKEVILVVNKADNIERIEKIEAFKRLGDFDLVPVSAISGKNTGDLLDLITKKLKPAKKTSKKPDISLAILGRPNVGKSTLINSILGEKRAIVSSEAGTTRDSVEIRYPLFGKDVNIIDTAGLRRRGKIEKDTIESFSVLRTIRALRFSDISILIIDGIEGLVANDTHILGQAKEWGKGLILAVNKIDLWETPQEEMRIMLSKLQTKLNFTPWLPVVFISAKDQENIKALLKQVEVVYNSRQTVIPQVDLDQILEYARKQNSQLVGLTSLQQKKNNPPIFELKYKGKKPPHYTQIRYLENVIRDVYPMPGTPIFIDIYHRK